MDRHVLVPLDGSRLAESVLPIVERLGGVPGTRVFLLHVQERGAPAEVHGDRHLRAVGEAAEYLDGVAERLRAAGVEVEVHAHEAAEGDVVRSIAEHAEEAAADLIVLCTHGSGRMRERLFGSIAQRVLARGTTPVLLARPLADGGAAPFEPRTILVALDGTAAAEAALRPAADLARELGTRLHLVMVVATQETMQRDRASATLFPAATRAMLDLEEADACGYLEELAGQLRGRGLIVTTEVRRGSAASALVAEAAEPGVGLVVLATHGRAGVQAIWAGSVAAQLLMRTSAPVLLLRRVEEEARQP